MGCGISPGSHAEHGNSEIHLISVLLKAYLGEVSIVMCGQVEDDQPANSFDLVK
jgi:hypothetical protein